MAIQGAECCRKNKEQTQTEEVLLFLESCRKVKAASILERRVKAQKVKPKAPGVWDAYRHGEDRAFDSERGAFSMEDDK